MLGGGRGYKAWRSGVLELPSVVRKLSRGVLMVGSGMTPLTQAAMDFNQVDVQFDQVASRVVQLWEGKGQVVCLSFNIS